MTDPAVDANEYLLEYLASIDNLSPEIQHIFHEIENKDKEVEDIRRRMKILQKKLWNMMDSLSSDEDSEDDDDDDSRYPSKKRMLDGASEDKKYTESELKQIIREGYDRAILLSEEKVDLVGKALNLVRRHLKRMDDDFVALFPNHTLPNYTPTTIHGNNNGGSVLINSNSLSIHNQPNFDFESLARRSPSFESEDAQFSLPLLPNPQNGGGLSSNQLASIRGPGRKSGLNNAGGGRKRGSRSRTPINNPNANNNGNNTIGGRGIKFRITSEDYQFNDFGGSEDMTFTEEVLATSSFTAMAISEPTYCYCRQVSFGEMIGCDGEDCPYEWFHIGCVGLEKVPKGKWFCNTCAPMKQTLPSQPMKKRKRGRPVGSTKSNMTSTEEFQHELSGLSSFVNLDAAGTSSVQTTEVLPGGGGSNSPSSDSESDSESSSGANSPGNPVVPGDPTFV
ncbi:5140_t:CDS:10 [Ambispora gerdemannii]|uniref:Chromatin modification-related protein n=1 Tax=Ambispora gerdemannii TaxID=144530 RepID=A0A9N9AA85_9GLOM|nr:5140_t:CDS:10 [Ambispora gerdemannii]